MKSSSILIVDDIPANLHLLIALLDKEGYRLRPVCDGKLALASARHCPPDLVLLDVEMPGMDGYEVCRRLKADERTRQIPVIFISARHELEDRRKAFEAGGAEYICKPFLRDELLARIRAHV